MILLQAACADHQFILWAECAATPGGTPNRGSRNRTPVHPFAATADELTAAVSAAHHDLLDGIKPNTVTVWLPSVAGKPVPSSPLLGEMHEGTAELKPWQVPAFIPGVDVALDLLAGIGEQPTLAPGIGVGVTLRYWSVALRFAAALVVREQFLPNVVQRGPEWFGRWTPIIAGQDASRFTRLMKAMPPACRAVGEVLPDRPAADVVRDFVGFVVDELVRVRIPEKPRTQFHSIHDRWLHALRSATGLLEGTDADAVQLAAQVREWRAPITAMADAPFRLCFRLDDLGEAEQLQAWHVRYLLQGRDDPSLQIPAADVWAGKARVARADSKPILLAGLGQAAKLSPEIDATLKAATPTGYVTNTEGAHRFLTETAWLLEQAGFGVLLPAWWTGHATKHKIAVTAKVKSPPMSGGGGLSPTPRTRSFLTASTS